MSAMYYTDFDCTPASRAIAHADTVHMHYASEHHACLEFLSWLSMSKALHDAGKRYYCIRGPGGLVRGVKL